MRERSAIQFRFGDVAMTVPVGRLDDGVVKMALEIALTKEAPHPRSASRIFRKSGMMLERTDPELALRCYRRAQELNPTLGGEDRLLQLEARLARGAHAR
jgi:hypothetical protein